MELPACFGRHRLGCAGRCRSCSDLPARCTPAARCCNKSQSLRACHSAAHAQSVLLLPSCQAQRLHTDAVQFFVQLRPAPKTAAAMPPASSETESVPTRRGRGCERAVRFLSADQTRHFRMGLTLIRNARQQNKSRCFLRCFFTKL